MKVSYNWLNTYFDGKLPPPEQVAEELTFHAWEIEEVIRVADDVVLDVKVLPDKAMWALSHRGIAKDLSTILDLPLTHDPLASVPALEPKTDTFTIKIDSPHCRRFAAARIQGVTVGPSPEWLRMALESIGQRSINNLVDASNYVMFDLGQPSHAFDAIKLPGDGIQVRQALPGETLAALDENEYTFSPEDTLISSLEGRALSIAGIKGGKDSGITEATTDIIIEVANWDPITTRKTAARLKLRSDASTRYENGIVPEMVPFGLQAVVRLILEVAGGAVTGYVDSALEIPEDIKTVTVTLAKVNRVLGLQLTVAKVMSIFDRFGWKYEMNGDTFIITPPFERTDLAIPEDIIEEVGRIYGYEHVAAITPDLTAPTTINRRFYYSEAVRDILVAQGFSEIYTSSFRASDQVKLHNALAADKGYLRSRLAENMKDALAKNAPNADLLGLKQISLFEIGTVFGKEQESYRLCLGIQSPSGYKPKSDGPILQAAWDALRSLLPDLPVLKQADLAAGICEIDLGETFASLPAPAAYGVSGQVLQVSYKPFSVYPAIARDIAMWVGSDVDEGEIADLLRTHAGSLCVRITLFDRFQKDEKISYAYRLVFQSKEKTLTDAEVNTIMDGVYQAVSQRGFTTR